MGGASCFEQLENLAQQRGHGHNLLASTPRAGTVVGTSRGEGGEGRKDVQLLSHKTVADSETEVGLTDEGWRTKIFVGALERKTLGL